MASLDSLVFLPQPQRIAAQAGVLALPLRGMIFCASSSSELQPVVRYLQRAIRQTLDADWAVAVGCGGDAGAIVLRLDSASNLSRDAYTLKIAPAQISITAATAAGAFYGVATLKQILRQCGRSLPLGQIDDQPEFPDRGVMLDISRDKVPSMVTLRKIIDDLADLKCNQVQLYTEHTFAYHRHRRVWAAASPMTAEEILELDAYCRERFIELVPNQNSFGHMERWLKHAEYADMGETANALMPNGEYIGNPFCLDPSDPRSLGLVRELYDELLPNFTSDKFNIGCDETFDLGQGKSKALCEEKGKYNVYFEFLMKLHNEVQQRGRRMMFWGDIIMEHPELVSHLPKDIIPLNWGYEASHPFETQCPHFENAGLTFYVCPGTASWASLLGRVDNMMGNLRKAAVVGRKHGAAGFLNTNWGDGGHWQYLPVEEVGFAYGAAMAWNAPGFDDANFATALDRHVFFDAAGVMGRMALDLGNAYQHNGALLGNSCVVFAILHGWSREKIPESVTVETLGATIDYVNEHLAKLEQSSMARGDAALVIDEFRNGARMAIHACRRGQAMISDRLGDAATKRVLAAEMFEIIGEHQRLWTARNRIGGLLDSMHRFVTMNAEYKLSV